MMDDYFDVCILDFEGEWFPDFDQDAFDETAEALKADGYEMIFASQGRVYVFRKYNVVH